MVKAIAISVITFFLKKYPNDEELGREIRKYFRDNYGIK